MAGLVAKGYGEALFEIGLECNKLDQFKQECHVVLSTMTPELAKVLNHPKVRKQEKKELLEKIYGKDIDHLLLNYMRKRLMYIIITYISHSFLYRTSHILLLPFCL